jgi:hypothetical protein
MPPEDAAIAERRFTARRIPIALRVEQRMDGSSSRLACSPGTGYLLAGVAHAEENTRAVCYRDPSAREPPVAVLGRIETLQRAMSPPKLAARARLLGGMIDSVARDGYAKTSAVRVVAYAGASLSTIT